jgi:hypothetical protein
MKHFGAMIRSVGSVLLSLVVAFILIVALEGISAVVHPVPPDFDGTSEAMHEHVANYPDWVLAVVVVIWGATTFVSTWLATRLGTNKHPAHGIAVGLLLFAAVVFNMYLLPYPLWFEAANVAVFLLCIYWGVKLGRTPTNKHNGATE